MAAMTKQATENQALSEKQPNGRSYGGKTLSERKALRRKQFLEAGVELFGTEGYRATTVRTICKQAKLTDRYFYESFGNLESLVIAVYEDCMGSLTNAVLETIRHTYQSGSALEAMEAGLDRYFQMLENSKVAQICMIELEGISPEVNKLYNAYIRSFATILSELARQAFPEWKLDAAEREVIGISLVGALRQSSTHWLMTDYAAPRHAMVAGTMKLFTGLINHLNDTCSEGA